MDITHGTSSAYNHRKCRCDECKAYKRRIGRAYYERRIGRPVRTPQTLEQLAAKNTARAVGWNKTNSERRKATTKRYREHHREELRRKGREYWERVPVEKKREAALRWSKTPKGRIHRREAAHRRRGATPNAEAREYMAILLKDPCIYCGKPATEIDHIVPLTDGGTGAWDNLAGICRSCNSIKGNRAVLAILTLT